MRALIANTDYDWYRFLSAEPDVDEANFWRPAGLQFNALAFGEPLVFKLRQRHGSKIVGFGLFAAFRILQVREAWEVFGRNNGAPTLDAFRYALGTPTNPHPPQRQIGCILLASPVFFPPDLWITGPQDWRPQIVAGKGYDTVVGEGRRIWQECLERTGVLAPPLVLERRYGAEILIRPRLGQGTFRYAVETAYGGACAVSGEHSRPALEAAHIEPYVEGGPHEIPNGILLRADLHRLFDAGYVSVTPDLQFRVSERLRAEFSNGRSYYPLDGRRIVTPSEARFAPNRDRLARHYETRFLR
jgi:putative restriction endonuclease